MLGKLFKHEFFYMVKRFLPVYVVYLAVSIIIRLLVMVEPKTESNESLDFALSMSTMTLTVLFCIGFVGMILLSIFGNITRFHKNLFGDEGYLMNTLPVPSWYHIFCKLATGFIWYSVSGIIAFGGIMIAFFGAEDFKLMSIRLERIFNAENWGEIVLVFITSAAAYCAFLLLCYMGEAIVSMRGNKKFLSVIVIIGCLMVNSIISGFLSALALGVAEDSADIVQYVIKLVYYAVVSLILFLLTNSIIIKRLNLQ